MEQKKEEKKLWKILFLIYHGIVIVVFSAAIVLLLMPNAKKMLLKTPFGKFLVKTQVSEKTFEKVHDEEFDKKEIIENKDIDTEVMDKYLNIALFGLDSREQSLDETNSDTIMIVSIDKTSKKVKLVSVYRDSYQKIYRPNNAERYFKINNAYALGGAEGAINTLNQNFDLDIGDYVAVNFNGIATIIDLLGGVDVTITDEERNYINGYLTETRKITGLDADNVDWAGKVHLNGLQATAYCRIRYTAVYLEDGTVYNNDFGRTARQRLVLTQLVEKAKSAGLSQVMNICKEVFKSENKIFKTSMEYEEVMDLIPLVLDFSLDSTKGYPFTYDDDVTINSASCIVVKGHAYNVAKLHEYLFKDQNYQPSQMVWKIDEKLAGLTGLRAELLPEDQGNEKYQIYLKHDYSKVYDDEEDQEERVTKKKTGSYDDDDDDDDDEKSTKERAKSSVEDQDMETESETEPETEMEETTPVEEMTPETEPMSEETTQEEITQPQSTEEVTTEQQMEVETTTAQTETKISGEQSNE